MSNDSEEKRFLEALIQRLEASLVADRSISDRAIRIPDCKLTAYKRLG